MLSFLFLIEKNAFALYRVVINDGLVIILAT
jgi:hypothetical protein